MSSAAASSSTAAPLSLALPTTSLVTQRPVSRVVVSPVALATVLDHHLRRGTDQDRVFGTLLGVRRESDNQIDVRSAFGVPYQALGRGEVTVDMDHHKSLLELHLRVNPREVVVGWYATSPELNSFSALIHNFYSAECAPHTAVHLTLDANSLDRRAYTAQQIGTTSKPDHLAFLPVDCRMHVHDQDRPALDLLTHNLTTLTATAQDLQQQQDVKQKQNASMLTQDLPLTTPLATMYGLLLKVSSMLDAVLEYVHAVAAGERQGDERVGRALLETVGVVPTATSPSAESATSSATTLSAPTNAQKHKLAADTKTFEEDFNAHLADVLMVSYLANVVKTQTELSSRLALLP
ncbi:hypothetical protein OIO90_002641 [Microbotryomycetes sp. JL221]|nr:hypothetical protein OIO90_002641 [Microbotryomycetes sp. JL221]